MCANTRSENPIDRSGNIGETLSNFLDFSKLIKSFTSKDKVKLTDIDQEVFSELFDIEYINNDNSYEIFVRELIKNIEDDSKNQKEVFSLLLKTFEKVVNISLQRVYSLIDQYKESIINDKLMKIEVSPLTDLKFILEYLLDDKKLIQLKPDEVELVQDILDYYHDFLNNKSMLLEKFYEDSEYDSENINPEFAKEYNNLFDDYYIGFSNQEAKFYEDFYVSKNDYENAVEETFNILGNL